MGLAETEREPSLLKETQQYLKRSLGLGLLKFQQRRNYPCGETLKVNKCTGH
jgi:hypothetical protein